MKTAVLSRASVALLTTKHPGEITLRDEEPVGDRVRVLLDDELLLRIQRVGAVLDIDDIDAAIARALE